MATDENKAAKGEIDRNVQFLLLPLCFQMWFAALTKIIFERFSKVRHWRCHLQTALVWQNTQYRCNISGQIFDSVPGYIYLHCFLLFIRKFIGRMEFIMMSFFPRRSSCMCWLLTYSLVLIQNELEVIYDWSKSMPMFFSGGPLLPYLLVHLWRHHSQALLLLIEPPWHWFIPFEN